MPWTASSPRTQTLCQLDPHQLRVNVSRYQRLWGKSYTKSFYFWEKLLKWHRLRRFARGFGSHHRNCGEFWRKDLPRGLGWFCRHRGFFWEIILLVLSSKLRLWMECCTGHKSLHNSCFYQKSWGKNHPSRVKNCKTCQCKIVWFRISCREERAGKMDKAPQLRSKHSTSEAAQKLRGRVHACISDGALGPESRQPTYSRLCRLSTAGEWCFKRTHCVPFWGLDMVLRAICGVSVLVSLCRREQTAA